MGTSKDIRHREFQVFVKPSGPLCNLNCSYCYYINNPEISDAGPAAIMDSSVVETFIQQQIEATTEPLVIFSWHGGEPLLAGIDFYRKAVAIQKKECPAGKKIINGIQTNGTLLNEDWCRFFADENFLAGLSMDGPENLHNKFRKGKDGSGTFQRVLKGFDLLVMYGVEPEILCVVNSFNSLYPLETYDFFRKLGVSNITFIPLVEKIDDQMAVTKRSVTPEAFGSFLCTIFDRWTVEDIGKIKVQIFEEALRTAFNQKHTLCIFRPECGGVPVLEHNGNFYSCDHFVNSGHLIGNIATSAVAEMLDSQRQRSFGRLKYDSIPLYCRQCEVIGMCNGECPKNRFALTPDGEHGLNYLCKGYRKFFNHCRPFVEMVAKIYREKE